jgi:DNA mismatch repair protein MSH4
LTSETFNTAFDLINTCINEDVTYQKTSIGLRNQRCYAVKAGWNGLLDVARQTYREATNDIYELVQTYSATYNIRIHAEYTTTQKYIL